MKKFFAVTAVLFGMVGALYSTGAVALPDNARIVTYYSDASMTEVVGESGNGCKSGFSWGVKTPYYTIETFDCF